MIYAIIGAVIALALGIYFCLPALTLASGSFWIASFAFLLVIGSILGLGKKEKAGILLSIGTKVSLSPIGQPANAVQEAVLPVQNIATTPSRTPEMVDGEANSEATA